MKLEDIGFLEVVDERAQMIASGKLSYCEWIITSNCNFNCPYCNRLEPRNTPDLTIDQIRSYTKTLAGMDCKYVHLTGGEPTTRKDLRDIVRMIREFNIRVGISTNGSRRLTYYEDLIEAGVELFSISLDVHQRDLNPKFTMVPANVFDVVASNIRELSKMVYTNVGVVFNDDNAERYGEIIEFISGLGTYDIRIMTATRYNKIISFDLDSGLLAQHPILKFRVENFNAGRNMRGSGLSTTPRCHLVRDDITIFGEDFYPCAVYIREGGLPIGKFGADNVELRESWFESHNSHRDEICRTYCMDFKCRFNDRVEAVKP